MPSAGFCLIFTASIAGINRPGVPTTGHEKAAKTRTGMNRGSLSARFSGIYLRGISERKSIPERGNHCPRVG